MNIRELQDEIVRLKKEKDFCILAHVYENREIVEIADYIGDSFGLSQQAAKAPQKNVIMCGVRFMAENQIADPEHIKSFDRLGYRFDPARSDSNLFVFILNATGG